MPRPIWKGNFLAFPLYSFLLSLIEIGKSDNNSILKKLYRRNTKVAMSMYPLLQLKNITMYTGYEFIDKVIGEEKITNINLATLINTREINVKHKSKQTKGQKNNAAQLAKKKLINVSKSKGKKKLQKS